MADLVPISWFVDQLKARLKAKDGYIMGSLGQDPKKWSVTSWYFKQYTSSKQHAKALYWREHAERVWDCNGMAEGLYMDYTGININTKARYNFQQWCSVKGWGRLPDEYIKPGVAVFKASKKGTASSIHHVGYVSRVEGSTIYIIEAKGVMYGVVETVYNKDSAWNAWGVMDKYFEYDADHEDDEPVHSYATLRKGDRGDDVQYLQMLLINKGYNLAKFGADGDFGSVTEKAVKTYQYDQGLEVDGIVGKQTWTALTYEEEEE